MRNRSLVFTSKRFLIVLALVMMAVINKDLDASSKNFKVDGTSIVDLTTGKTLFLKGIGYSPFFPNETPVWEVSLPNDARYANHLNMIKDLNANFLLVFPQFMPKNFFTALDEIGFLYAQDIYVNGYTDDLLDDDFQSETIKHIKKVIDHTYSVGKPDKLVFFSIGDEINAGTIDRTDKNHPGEKNYEGKHIKLTDGTPSEVAIAKLIDAAMSYEEEHYGIKHLYTHTSWTHIGPVADRPDLEVSDDTLFFADFADIICMNVYTYARGVKTSPGGSVTGRPYQGYIEDLIKISHKPVVITQVGLSTSPNAPDSDIPDFGGNSYEKVSSVFSNVWEDIKTASGSSTINGVAWFEFMDEWWKNGEDSNDELSHNDSDPEEWFGMYSVNDDYKSLSAKGSIPGTVKDLFTNSIPSDSNVPKGSVSINSGADYTNSTTVTLSLSATDVEGVTGYCVSTGSSTPLLYSTKWVSATATTSYTGSVSYSFSGGDGSKTVYVWYKDTDGNVSDTTSDSIILNKTAPTVAITSPSSNPNYTTTNSAINLSGNASDSASGLSGIAWRNSKGGSGTASGTDNWTISSIALL